MSCHISFVIAGFDGGGGPQSSKDIMDSLSSVGIKSELYPFKQTICRPSGRVSRFVGILRSIFFLVRYLYKSSSTKDKNIVFNSAGIFVGLLLASFSFLFNFFLFRNIKLVQIFHNSVVQPHKSKTENRVRCLLCDFIIFVCERFVCVSHGVYNAILHDSFLICPAKKGLVIYNAVKNLYCKENDSFRYSYVGPVILSVGRLCEQKSFDTLIRAVSLVKKQYKTNVNLVIVGDGPLRQYLQQLSIDCNVAELVHFWGYDENVSRHYQVADLFVLSSAHEGFGLVLVEALSFGLPVISTDCQYGPSEILENGKYGLLVPTHDPQALCDAIFSVLSMNSEEREVLSSRAVERSLFFSKEKLSKQYSELISEILDSSVVL